jgi:hypothetical protein
MYQEFNVTGLAEVPALIASFAQTLGWTVSGNTITRPGGGLPISVVYTTAANEEQNLIAQITVGGVLRQAITRNPRLGPGGTSALPTNVLQPNKIHLFGNTTPEPWIGCVIDYGFNRYRHLYIGNMVKQGSYGGGECVSTVNALHGFRLNTALQVHFSEHKYLFNSWNNMFTADDSGGVHIDHADNTSPWRMNRTANVNVFANTSMTDNMVIGGYGDSINDSLLARARNTYAGAALLIPINLFATRLSGADVLFSPIGHPAGVRMVNVEDIQPFTLISVGNVSWRVFPAISRRIETLFNNGTGGWIIDETSFNIGYAYPQD